MAVLTKMRDFFFFFFFNRSVYLTGKNIVFFFSSGLLSVNEMLYYFSEISRFGITRPRP